MLCVLIRIVSMTHHAIINIKKKTTLNYPKYNNVCRYGIFSQGTQDRVRNSRGKRAIGVWAIEVLLYFYSSNLEPPGMGQCWTLDLYLNKLSKQLLGNATQFQALKKKIFGCFSLFFKPRIPWRKAIFFLIYFIYSFSEQTCYRTSRQSYTYRMSSNWSKWFWRRRF